MGNIGIIIQREFNERVKKRTFILTTLITPILMVALMFAPALLMHLKTSEAKNVLVLDGSGIVASGLENDSQVVFEVVSGKSLDQIKEEKKNGGLKDVFGVLVIGGDVVANPQNVQLYTYEASTMEIEKSIGTQISNIIEQHKLRQYDIENLSQILAEVDTNVVVKAFRVDESGGEKESSSVLAMALAFAFGIMIYMFVFMYGGMVLQGVVEEKSSKVLEVMVSSVKPFDLMMGKILGIAAVAITQFLIWIVLIFAIASVVMSTIAAETLAQAATAMDTGGAMPAGMDAEMFTAINTVTDVSFILKMLGGFVVYFFGGYLLYAAMFAAVGSAVDNVADSQQLQMPITIPIILAFVVMMNVVKDPHSTVAFWFSMIPFTSPIIMVARMPYGVPVWELLLSVAILYASFVFMVWMAAKIYRVGIFMYGKKPSLKELVKWSKYKY